MNKCYTTYMPTCECGDGIIKRWDGVVVCRWCRRPYRTAGHMFYARKHFKAPYGVPVKRAA